MSPMAERRRTLTDLSRMIPDKLIFVVERVVGPLFLLFNVLGWFGLPDREANRLPANAEFRARTVAKRRQILTWLVLAAVSISVVCAVLYGTYYTSIGWMRHLIASAYAFMLVGYSV